jgi:lipopolysaccharide/colanic/teichoic acid biosynthesis glycosyltransferase
VSGRNEISFQEWMELDVEYIDSWSLANDLRILARTVPQVLMARGAR